MAAGNYSLVTNTSAYSAARIDDIDVSGDLNASEVTITISPEGVTSVKGSTIAPATFELSQNYPNPFNPSTVIKYSVPAATNVTLSVYNVIGQKVATLVNEVKNAGTYEVKFNASSLSSGLYIYKLETPGQTITRKMTLLK
ncbi:MAG: T9SS type A sorting domain-containing protein [Ignavibacteriaceae bacterium]|nr:T9SS type A sorting domain-containing protein [Ignavibacteriaceae bacterium]